MPNVFFIESFFSTVGRVIVHHTLPGLLLSYNYKWPHVYSQKWSYLEDTLCGLFSHEE